MSKLTQKVQTILENWHGEDDAGRKSPRQVAEEIDREMEEYLRSLPKKTEAILAGQSANERRVA